MFRRMLFTLIAAVACLAGAVVAPTGSASAHTGESETSLAAGPDSLLTPDELGVRKNEGAIPGTAPIPEIEGCRIHTPELYGGRSLRDALDLSERVDPNAATEERLGIKVTPDEAQQIDESRAQRKLAKERFAEVIEADATVVGASWSYADRVFDVYVTGRAAIKAPVGSEGLLRFNRIDSDLDLETVNQLKTDLLAAHNVEHDDKPLGITYDPSCGVVLALVASEAQEKPLHQVVEDRGLPASTLVTVVDPGSSMSPADRYDYHVPNTGGLSYQIQTTGAGPFDGRQCTSAIAFRNAVNESLYAITAAHCLPSPQNSSTAVKQYHPTVDWFQGLNHVTPDVNLWNGSYYVYGGNMDIAWTKIRNGASGGISAQARSMTHGNHTYQGMGWWQWDQSMASDGGFFGSGDLVCHSGVNWAGAPCGEILDDNWAGNTCNPSGCGSFNGLIRTSMLAYGGDSGGTVWSHKDGGIWYVGVMSASNLNPNNPRSLYSHIGNLDDLVNYLDSPVDMF